MRKNKETECCYSLPNKYTINLKHVGRSFLSIYLSAGINLEPPLMSAQPTHKMANAKLEGCHLLKCTRYFPPL